MFITTKYDIGEIVTLRPFDDIRAVVRGYAVDATGVRYECAWFTGDNARYIELFQECELANG